MTKRSLSPEVISTNKFLSLPASAQALYFHLNLNADDDGVVDRVHAIAHFCGADINDVDTLINQGYLITLNSAKKIYVITDWLVNNAIRKDRYKPTIYGDELAKLGMHNKRYYLR